jgi:hypothetical protein
MVKEKRMKKCVIEYLPVKKTKLTETVILVRIYFKITIHV